MIYIHKERVKLRVHIREKGFAYSLGTHLFQVLLPQIGKGRGRLQCDGLRGWRP